MPVWIIKPCTHTLHQQPNLVTGMTGDRKKAAQRIAMAQSKNANEAQAAFRQANALMQKCQLTETDVAASFVNEGDTQISTPKTLPYIKRLLRTIANVCGCEALISRRCTNSTIKFVTYAIKILFSPGFLKRKQM